MKLVKFTIIFGAFAWVLSTNSHAQTTTWLGDNVFTGNVDVGTTGSNKNLTVTGTVSIDGAIGVGTANPLAKLHIAHTQLSSTDYPFVVQSANTSASGIKALFLLRSARGTIASPSAVHTGDVTGQISIEAFGTGNSASDYGGSSNGRIKFIAEENFTSTSKATALVLDTAPSGAISGLERMRITGGGNVGIGTAAPSTKLDVNGDVNVSGKITVSGTMQLAGTLAGSSLDGVVFGGTSGNGSIPVEGAGTRMMWYPGKGAFRAGVVSGTQWDDENIGVYSIGMGVDAEARGTGAFAAGINSYAGQYGVAMGYSSTASVQSAIAIGDHVKASAYASVAFGSYTTASGGLSLAAGMQSTASGVYSIAMGGNVSSSGQGTIGLGESLSVSGDNAFATGFGNSAAGAGSFVAGIYNTTSGEFSVATGFGVIANSYGMLALGQYNVGISGTNSTSAWIDDDPIVEIGSGTSENDRRNAFTFFKNGNLRAGGIIESKQGVRVAPQGDLSMGEFTAGDNPADLDPTTGLRYSGE